MEFRIEMPLVPDGGPETGPFIGELPATHPTDGALLAERLLDFCRNDPVGISPDRNRDRVFDAADFLAAAFE